MKMRKLTLLLLIVVMISSCGNGATKKALKNAEENNAIDSVKSLKLTDMKLAEEEWQAVQSSYDKIKKGREDFLEQDESGEAEMDLSNIVTPQDIVIGGMIQYHALKQQGLTFLSDHDYLERIKNVFGIDLNSQKSNSNLIRVHDDYIVVLTPTKYYDDQDNMVSKEFYPNRNYVYLFKKLKLSVLEMPTAIIIQMGETTDKDNVVIYKNPFFYHWNNYVLNNNQGSLVWLLNNEYTDDVKRLFLFFGYDKDEKINKLVLDDPNLDYRILFAFKNIYGKLQIRDGLLNTITDNSTKDFNGYYKTLEGYANALSGDDLYDSEGAKALLSDFSLAERRKILAYVINTLQPLYEKYNPQCIGGEYGVLDKYDIGVTDSFWNICFRDKGLITEIEANNCYGLSNLEKLIAKMRADSRLINPETGALEPWIFSPEAR